MPRSSGCSEIPFVDPTGGQAIVEFDIDLHGLGGAFVTQPDDTFSFKIDGATVFEIDASDVDASSNFQFQHLQFLVDTGAPGTHTLELLHEDHGSVSVGFAIDSIQIHDWII